MIIKVKYSNFPLADFIAKLNIGSKRRLRFITIFYNKKALDILKILYKEGIIRLIIVYSDKIRIYFKYNKCNPIIKFKLISKPSKRIYWTLHQLSLNYSKHRFFGFYIISTSKGLFTSTECLLYNHISGEVLLKVYI